MEGTAADFQLLDQRGEMVVLSELRGRVVLLAFLDPNCTDVCPLTALQFRQIHEALGKDADRVALLAVNVNPDANAVDDVARASRAWRVDEVATWHFLTGSADELKAVWADYKVHGGEPKRGKPGEVQHTPGVFVIDAAGKLRWYASVPLDEAWDGPSLDQVLLAHIRQLLRE